MCQLLNSDDANPSVKKAACGANITLRPQAYPHMSGVTKYRDPGEDKYDLILYKTDKFQSSGEFNWS